MLISHRSPIINVDIMLISHRYGIDLPMSGQWELALFLFSNLATTELLGESSFGAAIGACARAAKWSTAVALLRRCRALADGISGEISLPLETIGKW